MQLARPPGILAGRPLLLAVAYGAVAMLFAPYTWPQRLATAIPCLVALAIVVRRGWHRSGSEPSPGEAHQPRAAVAVWIVLIFTAVAVQMLNFYEWPREVYPTLSSLANRVLPAYPVRVAAFTAWLWLGWYFIDR